MTVYLKEMDREAKRNAWIRNERILLKDEEDIPSAELAHIRRRKAKPTRCRWVAMLAELSKNPEESGRYLTRVRSEVEALGKKRKERARVRTLSEY